MPAMVWDPKCHRMKVVRTTGFLDNFMFSSLYFEQLKGLDGDRKSDHSDSESVIEDDYLLAQ